MSKEIASSLPKPIFLVNLGDIGNREVNKDVQKQLQLHLPDYHILVISTSNITAPTFRAFYPTDYPSLTIDEVMKQIKERTSIII